MRVKLRSFGLLCTFVEADEEAMLFAGLFIDPFPRERFWLSLLTFMLSSSELYIPGS